MTVDRGDFAGLVAAEAGRQESRPGLALDRAWQGLPLSAIRADLTARLTAAGIDEAASDARFLMERALHPASLAVALGDPAPAAWQIIAALADLAVKRLARQPLAQVLGDKPFWTLDLKVTRDVLTPRADTETLVETVLREIDDKSHALDIADFGTGSGAILLALLSEMSNAKGLGIDISEQVLAVARENAERNNLANRTEFRTGNWADGLDDRCLDIAVSNPPYIASDVIAGLEPEVRDYEPRIALDGGRDGLEIYRRLLRELFRVLRPGGLMAVEIGFDQGRSVLDIARAVGFKELKIARDLGGHERIVSARRPMG
ncbi:peptide chain release factor N(5)-glutamine methyltransferase [Hyphobacterium sp.]|uniref:peptide chain release factor N(5)-glutamine methyltransferase n=1 Tax=Hyphobacterium sp. TaxID=2004662 RepID=UPI003BAD1BA4